MPNRFNDRENGESSNFPQQRREQDRIRNEQNLERGRGEWHELESGNESIWRERERTHPRYSLHGTEFASGGPTGFQGEYGPAPRHTRAGQSIDESMGAYPGQEYRRGVYGYESPDSGDPRFYGERGRHTGRGPKGYRRTDERITEDVNERLTQHPFVDATEIEVRVQEGEVILTGTVEDRVEKRMAEDAAESVSGVKDIQNQIRVKRTR